MNLEHVKWRLLLSIYLFCVENTHLTPLSVNKSVFHTYDKEKTCPWALTGNNQGAVDSLSSLSPTTLSITSVLERSFGKEK